MASLMSNKVAMRSASRHIVAKRPARSAVVRTQAALDPAIIVSASTAAFLSVGRFVFLPYQRREGDLDVKLGPKTTGTTFFDDLQKPASFVLTSKDPAGFTLIDVFGWGALGHAFAYFILATSSLHDAGVNPWPNV
ncbi:hypothetical protein CEUSTIGMA_g5878.t1 [Chlamydomonas eustigma]|uniref:PSI-G n=1 Tax=Chlamydomonas eustigma TaxID=1157962 RepID=A0A250X5S0_9CHLO|nr:hypothetical protein CEUSTIGMA_g5878.t1 [Chlamydomonas eustigma]|eukprot:GAX78437.1 hypothetical protein CEUSTIGMA_g5878.t1 [Chlamydomonas eustigma]